MAQTISSARPASAVRPASRAWVRAALAAAVFALALLVRLRAVELLPVDYDEDDYLRAGQLYAQHLAAGDVGGVVNERENYEHPPLTKLAYGFILLGQGPGAYAEPVTAYVNDQMPPRDELARVEALAQPLRTFSAVVGALTAGLVALVNPLAGLLVALSSWHIKYSSQAMLEALPCLFAAATLLSLRRSGRNGDLAFWASAIFLGLTAAGTYRYAAGGFAGLAFILWRGWAERPRTLALAAGWGGLALAVFYAANPALWPDPLGRIQESILFNAGFSTGEHVRRAGLPWFQPLVWMLGALPWNPGAVPLRLDALLGVAALAATRRAWADDRLLALWFWVNLVFLFLWPTKWPQYILALSVPVGLLAARWLGDAAARWRAARARPAETGELRAAWPWLAPASLVILAVGLYPLVLQLALAASDFQSINLRNGQVAFWEAFLRGALTLPPMEGNPLPYFGTGGLIYVWDLLPIAITNTLWVVVTIGLATLLGLRLATLLERPRLRGRGLWRALFILPWAIPEFVGAMVWNTIFDDTFGAINNLTGQKTRWLADQAPIVDLAAPIRPLAEALSAARLAPIGDTLLLVADSLSVTKAFLVLVIMGVWVAFPFMMLIGIAALRSVPGDVYEAARVDGADAWATWRHITWPLIRPAVVAGMLLRGILLFNAYHIPLQGLGWSNIRDDSGTLATIGYFLTRESNYSISALINTVILIVAIGLIWLFNRQTRVVEGDTTYERP